MDSVILQLDQRFSGHTEAVILLNSLLPADVVTMVVTANFCELEPAIWFFSKLQAPLKKTKLSLCCGKDFVKIILM